MPERVAANRRRLKGSPQAGPGRRMQVQVAANGRRLKGSPQTADPTCCFGIAWAIFLAIFRLWVMPERGRQKLATLAAATFGCDGFWTAAERNRVSL
ncbi:hypothetical protein H6P81_002820 [Aristolochia fimbriata]|uniref:Uncharacterized protein n=1 Tax=Aristolochia fimbriata TaxID=158543 RepID=A0AAV7FEY4_ARIFI|nr:hypothetical protein H6P81_002820 [Aristolochia fimbriata]